jgi:hypothetical protein
MQPRPRFAQAVPWIALAFVLVVGLCLRIYLAGTPGYAADLRWFYAWASAAHHGDVGSPYRLPGRLACNYPPAYVLVLSRVPWLYELSTAESFGKPSNRQTEQVDEMEAALQRLGARRQLVKIRELVSHYRKRDPKKYHAIMEGQHSAELVSLGLISRAEYRKMRELAEHDRKRYHEIRQRIASRVRAILDKKLPYDVPHRLRQLAVWVKLPALLFDLMGAATLFLLLRPRLGQAGGLGVAAVYVFLPPVIYNSAYWGQVDAVHSLLMLWCLASLVKRKVFLAGLMFASALLTKFQSIVVLPVLAAGLIRYWREQQSVPVDVGSRSWVAQTRRAVRIPVTFLLGAMLASGLILLPFVATGTADEALLTYKKAPGQYHWVSVCAFNPWWLFNSKPDVPRWYHRFTRQDQIPFLGPITPRHIGLAALAVFSLWVMYMVYRRGFGYEPLAAGAVTMAMGFFMLPTQIHERYGFPAIILSAYLLGAGWRHLPAFLVLSVAQFYNFAAVQPVEDPRFQWFMPVANALHGRGSITYLIVLIHLACLAYFTFVLYRLPVRDECVRRGY